MNLRSHLLIDAARHSVTSRALFGTLAIAVLLVCASGASTSPWKDRDWTQWTMQDCDQILHDSPWASTIAIGDFNAQDRVGTWGPTAQVVSSLAIRRAILRLDQLGAPITFAPGKPQRVDYQREDAACIDASFDDRIVVRFSDGSIFKTPPELIVSGRKVTALPGNQPTSGVCWIGGGGDVSYPKFVDGKPVFQPGKGKFVINTKLDVRPTQGRRPGRDDTQFIAIDTRFEFNVKTMVYKGKPDF